MVIVYVPAVLIGIVFSRATPPAADAEAVWLVARPGDGDRRPQTASGVTVRLSVWLASRFSVKLSTSPAKPMLPETLPQ